MIVPMVLHDGDINLSETDRANLKEYMCKYFKLGPVEIPGCTNYAQLWLYQFKSL